MRTNETETGDEALGRCRASALYELLLDGSGVGMKERWNKLKGWSDK